MSTKLIVRTAEYVQKRLREEGSGHDWFHTYRVWQMARYLQSKEGGDAETIEMAALLHCAAEHDLKKKSDEQVRSYTMMGILDILGIEGDLRENIISIARWCRFKGRDTERPDTLEGKIVQDANFLDVLGAVGIARGFSAGGYLGRPIHDPAIRPLPNASKEVYQKRRKEGTSVNYFYEKPLQILKAINTPTAKKIAEARLAFTNEFLERFFKEWNFEDIQ